MSRKMAPNREILNRYRENRRYFHSPTIVSRWKIQFTVLAIILSATWILVGWLKPSEDRDVLYSHGEVAECHSLWDQQCSACHQSSDLQDLDVGELVNVRGRWNSFSCENCHADSREKPKQYAPHHDDMVEQNQVRNDCAFCHADHQGKNFSLVKMADDRCTNCHADLKASLLPGKSTKIHPNISKLDGGGPNEHPEFALHRNQTSLERTIKFNHGLHMMPGIIAADALKSKPSVGMKLTDLPTEFREQYRGTNDSHIQLECASCHQTDSKVKLGSIGQGTGALMQPVTFDQHCKACHSLEMPMSNPLEFPGLKQEKLVAPHSLQPREFKRWLEKEVLSRLIEVDPKVREKIAIEAFQGRTDGAKPEEQERLNLLKSREAVTERLFKRYFNGTDPTKIEVAGNGCLKCHAVDSNQVIVVNSPAIWFKQARFSHQAHGAMDCSSCHPGMNEMKSMTGQEPPNIPNLNNCRACHSENVMRIENGKEHVSKGLNSRCVDCHRYHQHRETKTSTLSPFATPSKNSLKDYLMGIPQSRSEGPSP
jgi:predicted CXXCH cytochrome family protein